MARQLRNDEIIASEVDLYDEAGLAYGILSRSEALQMARERGCDLVQESIFSSPPRCTLIDAAKAAQQAMREARMAAGGPAKEIRVGTTMGSHDIEARVRQAAGLLEKGYSVKLSARLAKAERANPVAARALLDKLARDLATQGRPSGKPFGESGALSLLLLPRA